MADRVYQSAALEAARAAHLTAEQVEPLGYTQVAALAGAEIEKDNSSPVDFFYVNVRRTIANTLRAEAKAVAETAMMDAVLAKLDPTEREWLDEKLTAGNVAVEVPR